MLSFELHNPGLILVQTILGSGRIREHPVVLIIARPYMGDWANENARDVLDSSRPQLSTAEALASRLKRAEVNYPERGRPGRRELPGGPSQF